MHTAPRPIPIVVSKPGTAAAWAMWMLSLGLTATAIPASADPPPLRGAVQSLSVYEQGDVVFEREALRVGSSRIGWDALLTLKLERPRLASSQCPHRVHLAGAGGENWPGRVLRFDGEHMIIDLPTLGERPIQREALLGIDFEADLPWPPQRRGVLQRREGGPVPSTLTRFDEQTLTIDSTLGELKIDRDLAARYTFDRQDTGDRANHDSLTLIGGEVLYGKITPTAEAATIEHRWLGEVVIDWAKVESIRRRSPRVVYLADLEPTEQQTEALLADGLPVSVFVERIQMPGTLDAWALQPKLRQVYVMPKQVSAAHVAARLRVRVAPTQHGRGKVVLRVLGDDKPMWEGTIRPGDPPMPLDLPLRESKTLVLEVDYGDPMRFPLGVAWADPLLIIDP